MENLICFHWGDAGGGGTINKISTSTEGMDRPTWLEEGDKYSVPGIFDTVTVALVHGMVAEANFFIDPFVGGMMRENSSTPGLFSDGKHVDPETLKRLYEEAFERRKNIVNKMKASDESRRQSNEGNTIAAWLQDHPEFYERE